MKYQLTFQNSVFDVDIREEKEFFVITIGDEKFQLKDCVLQDYVMGCQIGDRSRQVYFAQDKDNYHLAVDGEYYVIQKAKAAVHGASGAAGVETNSVVSSMPGLLVKVPVKVGDEVKSGDTLAIVEAMKMQNELRAPRDGIVKEINFKEGEQVDAFQPIVELESIEE